MRIAFMGTPDFAVPTLDALIAAGHEIAAVYTQPPRPAGRGKALSPSPIQRRADGAGLEVRTPATLRDPDAQAAFAALGLDAAVVAAYGLILPLPILEAPRFGCLNVHGSLLPRGRGAAPIQRAILAGDEKTGICIMQMEKGLDTGPVYLRRETDVDRKTAGELTDELAAIGGALMVDVLDRIDAMTPEPQPEAGVTYAHKIEKAEAKLNFGQSAEQIDRQIRAFNPTPGAFIEFGGERIKILAAEIWHKTGRPCVAQGAELIKLARRVPGGTVLDDQLLIACWMGMLRPTFVQRAGRAAMTTEELLRGFPIPKGTRLG